MDWLPYIATIHARSEESEFSWQTWLLREFAALGMPFFASDGTLRESGPKKPTGRYEFVAAPQPATTPAMPWMRPSPCPYVGDLVGFVTWEWWTTGFEEHDQLARSLLFAGRGGIARSHGRGERFEAVVEEEFSLANFAQKHGFHDGDFFWDEPAYTAYVRGSLVRAVAAHGLKPDLFSGGTSHNAHRLSQFVPRGRQTFASCWETFSVHENEKVRLWGYNITGMKSAAYRALLTDE